MITKEIEEFNYTFPLKFLHFFKKYELQLHNTISLHNICKYIAKKHCKGSPYHILKFFFLLLIQHFYKRKEIY